MAVCSDGKIWTPDLGPDDAKPTWRIQAAAQSAHTLSPTTPAFATGPPANITRQGRVNLQNVETGKYMCRMGRHFRTSDSPHTFILHPQDGQIHLQDEEKGIFLRHYNGGSDDHLGQTMMDNDSAWIPTSVKGQESGVSLTHDLQDSFRRRDHTDGRGPCRDRHGTGTTGLTTKQTFAERGKEFLRGGRGVAAGRRGSSGDPTHGWDKDRTDEQRSVHTQTKEDRIGLTERRGGMSGRGTARSSTTDRERREQKRGGDATAVNTGEARWGPDSGNRQMQLNGLVSHGRIARKKPGSIVAEQKGRQSITQQDLRPARGHRRTSEGREATKLRDKEKCGGTAVTSGAKDGARSKRRVGRQVAGRGGMAKSESGEALERRYKGVARPSSRASSSDSSRFSLNSNRATTTSKRSHPSSDTSNTVGAQTSVRVTSTQIIRHYGMSRLSTERRGVGQRVVDKSDGAVLPDASTATTWSSRLNDSASSRNSDRPTRVIDDSGHVNTNSSKKTMQKKNIISATSAEDIRQYFRT